MGGSTVILQMESVLDWPRPLQFRRGAKVMLDQARGDDIGRRLGLADEQQSDTTLLGQR